MAQLNYSQINQNNTPTERTSGPAVKFFSLKNHGDEAIVRIMHDTTDSFDLVAVHPVELNGRYRNVNCIRDAREPLENCPMCAAGKPIRQKFYMHLLQYTRDAQGNIVVEACIWERSASYASTIANLINEYGPLSDHIFKIRRNGAAGSMDTTYDIMYGHPNVYRNELYPKQPELFDGYNVIGRAVLDKSAADMATFLQTGSFPAAPTANTSVTPKAEVAENTVRVSNTNQDWNNAPMAPRSYNPVSTNDGAVKAGPRYY